MSSLNKKVVVPAETTHEGAIAPRINAEKQLRRSVMSCMLWENEFYEDGQTIADRIAALVPQVSTLAVSQIAIEARTKMKLRHVPLLIVREMARCAKHKSAVSAVLREVIQRADELTEFVSIYWKDKKQPLSGQVKKGLALAFQKFSAFDLAKYNRDKAVKLRDVLFLCHAKPKDAPQATVWKKLVEGTLEAPDTWEVNLSAGKDKRETWERLLAEKKLGGLALLRNLRNMKEAGIVQEAIFKALQETNFGRVLPFRFIAAAKHAVQWEPQIEAAMLRCLENRELLAGGTVILIDVSVSMDAPISAKSDLKRVDAACGLAILAREMLHDGAIFTFSNRLVQVPPRRGFALRDAVIGSQSHGGTELGAAIQALNTNFEYDRLIVITDEQSEDRVPAPRAGAKGYMINVASNRNGVGYGNGWNHIDGWSEAILDYIKAFEEEKETL